MRPHFVRPNKTPATAGDPPIARQVVGVAGSIIPFGIVFGAAAADAGLEAWQAVAFSTFVFAGASQILAVESLSEGAPLVTAIVAGLLVNMRLIAFGLSVAPVLKGPLWRRMLMSQVVIDQTAAVATAYADHARGRLAFTASATGLFIAWILSTLAGNTIVAAEGSLVQDLGFDAVIPALFLALLWPRLRATGLRRASLAGAAIALATTPFVPVGVPLIAATAGALAAIPSPTLRRVRRETS